jgi:hypothetical protein
LILNRGALAVAFLICTFGLLLAAMFLGMIIGIFFAFVSALAVGAGMSSSFIVAIFVMIPTSIFIVLCALLHFRIGPRLEVKAGQL